MKKFGQKFGLFKPQQAKTSQQILSEQIEGVEAKVAAMSEAELTAGAFASCAGKNADLLIYLAEMRKRGIAIANLENENKDTLPGAACNNPQDNTLRLLLGQPEFKNYATDALGRTLLMRAAAAGQPAPIQGCLHTGDKSNLGKAMIVAINGGHDNVLANLLKDYGVPAYRQFEDSDSWNPVCHALKIIAPHPRYNKSFCLALILEKDKHCNLFQPTSTGVIPATCLQHYGAELVKSLQELKDSSTVMHERQPFDVLREQTATALQSTDINIKKIAMQFNKAFRQLENQSTNTTTAAHAPLALAATPAL